MLSFANAMFDQLLIGYNAIGYEVMVFYRFYTDLIERYEVMIFYKLNALLLR